MFWSEKGWWGAKISVTRFGEISRLWHNVKALWPFWKCSLCIWQNVELMLANFLCYWTYFDGVNSQILKVIYLVIWSHWHRVNSIKSKELFPPNVFSLMFYFDQRKRAFVNNNKRILWLHLYLLRWSGLPNCVKIMYLSQNLSSWSRQSQNKAWLYAYMIFDDLHQKKEIRVGHCFTRQFQVLGSIKSVLVSG